MVFLGKVISAEANENDYYQELIFEVLEPYKGSVTKNIEVSNAIKPGNSCSIVFEIKEGETWVIFANPGYRKFTATEASFQYRSQDLQVAIDYLRKASQGKSESAIYGEFTGSSYSPKEEEINFKLEGLKVIAEGSGKRFIARMNKEGKFNFPQVAKGKYKIKILLPQKIYTLNYSITGVESPPIQAKRDGRLKRFVYEYETEVKDKECTYDFIVARRISYLKRRSK
jgi:hypothetical protein